MKSVRLTFDPAKRDATLRHRGLDFRDAAQVFAGRYTVGEDRRRDYGEVRFVSAGVLRERVVVIVWTRRGEARHIISMRHCHAKEEERWLRELGRSG